MSHLRVPTAIESNADAKINGHKKQIVSSLVGEKPAASRWGTRKYWGNFRHWRESRGIRCKTGIQGNQWP